MLKVSRKLILVCLVSAAVWCTATWGVLAASLPVALEIEDATWQLSISEDGTMSWEPVPSASKDAVRYVVRDRTTVMEIHPGEQGAVVVYKDVAQTMDGLTLPFTVVDERAGQLWRAGVVAPWKAPSPVVEPAVADPVANYGTAFVITSACDDADACLEEVKDTCRLLKAGDKLKSQKFDKDTETCEGRCANGRFVVVICVHP